MNIIHKARLVLPVYRNLKQIRQFTSVNSPYHKKARAFVVELFNSLVLPLESGFPENGKLKMQWYIAEFMYVCQSFNQLHGTKSSDNEENTYLWAGALLTLCDLVIDDIPISEGKLKSLRHPDSESTDKSELEQLFSNCYHGLFNALAPAKREIVRHYYNRLFDAQLESSKQFDENISQQAVDEIAKAKCGYSMLFMRSLIGSEITTEEEDAIMELGAFVQFANDTQDMQKDYKNGIRSFATIRSNMETIQDDLSRQYDEATQRIASLPLSKSSIRDFRLSLYLMFLGIQQNVNVIEKQCKGQFSHASLSKIPMQNIRKETNWLNQLTFVIPRAFSFKE